jgi:hypothetical protein
MGEDVRGRTPGRGIEGVVCPTRGFRGNSNLAPTKVVIEAVRG